MKILILYGSPKGKNSITLQTALYLEKGHPEHTFKVLHIGQMTKTLEKDFSLAREALEEAELILFAYPVYTFLAPYQVHRFIELLKEDGVDLRGKYVSQLTTSKHFYDMTAHRYIEENCRDLGMRFIRGLSADMEDLLSERGQREAESWLEQIMFEIEENYWPTQPDSLSGSDLLERNPEETNPAQKADDTGKTERIYRSTLPETPKEKDYDVVIVTCCGDGEENLREMIRDFRRTLPCSTRVINLREFPFGGGCLGCLSCAVTGKCVYKDGFDTYLREEIQSGDAIVYAFSIENHYAHSTMKEYDDRQFCNGHRTVTQGSPVAYLISGDYSRERNLQMVVEARSEVGGNYLAGVATDEGDTAGAIQALADHLIFALEHKACRPMNFYGVGGTKIFRDLIYTMQGLMKADHKFYKEHGIYDDFPQKNRGTIWKMKLVGGLLAVPAVQEKMKGQLSGVIVEPYRKVIAGEESGAQAEEQRDNQK